MGIIHTPEPRPGIVDVGGPLQLAGLACCFDPGECRVGRLVDDSRLASLARAMMSLVTDTSRCSSSACHGWLLSVLRGDGVLPSCRLCRYGFPFQKPAEHAAASVQDRNGDALTSPLKPFPADDPREGQGTCVPLGPLGHRSARSRRGRFDQQAQVQGGCALGDDALDACGEE